MMDLEVKMNKYIIVFCVSAYVSAITLTHAMEEPKEPIASEEIERKPNKLEIFHIFEDLPNELQEYVLIKIIKDIVDSSDNIFEAHTEFSNFMQKIVLVNRYFRSLSGYFRNSFLKFMEEKFHNPFTRDTPQELNIKLKEIFSQSNAPKDLLTEEKIGQMVLAGADVNLEVTNQLEPILKKALTFGYEKLVKLLLEHGADPDAKNLSGYTLLSEAIFRNNDSIAELLLDKGADPNIKYLYGRTSLMEAVELNNNYIALQLLENDADICAKDIDGNTAYLIAKRNKNKEMAKRLKPTKKCVIS